MEIKTCEERVLAELDNAEKQIGELKEANTKMQQTLQYADNLVTVLKQICVLEEVDDGNYVFRGGFKLDKTEHAAAIELLKIFAPAKKETPAPEEKKGGPSEQKDAELSK